MTSLDDLRDSLDRYADRGEPRGAVAVLEAAQVDAAGPPDDGRGGGGRTRAGRWPARPVLVAIAALILLVVATVAVVRAQTDQATVVTPGPAPPGTDVRSGEGVDLRPIIVPDGRVDAVTIAFGRLWVVTHDPDPPESSDAARVGVLRSFDLGTGEVRSEESIYGFPLAFAATSDVLFLRTTTGGPASFPLPDGGQGDNAIYRIDPGTGEARAWWVQLNGDGPMAATSDRMAAADSSHVVVFDRDGVMLTDDTTIDAAVGVEQATFPGTNGIGWLAFADAAPEGTRPALFAGHQGRGELLELDPSSGRHVATRVIDGAAGRLGPGPVASDGVVWVNAPDGVVGATVPIGASTPATDLRYTPPEQVLELAGLGDGRVLVRMLDQAVVPAFAAEPGRVPGGNDGQTVVDHFVTLLDPAANGAIVQSGGRPFIAQWLAHDDPSAPTEIVFIRVITEPNQPEGVPATPPAAVLSVMTTDPLHDGQAVPIAAVGLPTGADVTLQLCLVADPDDGCDHPVAPAPLPVLRAGNAGGDGELLTEWTARRGLYDTTWHDCGAEACELRLYGVGDDGQPDRSRVLARARVTFEESGAIVRPSLQRADGDAVHAGDTLTVLGKDFPPGATIRLRLCPTGPQSAMCVDDGAEPAVAADDGTVELRFTIPSTRIGPDGALDCASGRGVCMLAVFGDERSVETYAATLLDFVPVSIGTTPGTIAR